MENSKEIKKPEVIKKENNEQPKPLFEDLKGHKHDEASFNKLMQEQTNRRKETETKTGI